MRIFCIQTVKNSNKHIRYEHKNNVLFMLKKSCRHSSAIVLNSATKNNSGSHLFNIVKLSN